MQTKRIKIYLVFYNIRKENKKFKKKHWIQGFYEIGEDF